VPILLRKALLLLLVFAVAAFLLLARLGAPPLDEAEARSAIVSRCMLNLGSWLWPEPDRPPFSCEKSPLVYWQAVPFACIELVMGQTAFDVSELAVRLPSVLWALALLFFTWDTARRWHDGLAALFAAAALATSYGFIHWGRHGTAEMAQAATILWCLWFFVKHRADGDRRWLPALGFFLGIAANFGAREAYGVVILGTFVLSAMAKDWAWLRPARTMLLALLVSLAVFLALPFAASQMVTASSEPFRALWREHVLRHLQSPAQAFGWHKDLWRLVSFCLPWLVLVPIAKLHDLWRWRRREARPSQAMLLAGAAVVWLALSSSREPRHVLAVVPFAAIIAGRLLAQFSREELAWLARGAVQIVLLLAGVVLIFLLVYSAGWGWAALVPMLAGAALVAAAVTRIGHAALAGVAALWLAHSLNPSLHRERGSDVRDQIAKVRRLGKPVAFVGQVPAQLAFYLRWGYSVLDGPADVQRWATEREGGIIIATRRPDDPSWQTVADGAGWQAFTWNPQARAVSLTRDPAWLAKHPLRGIKSETLTYVFSAQTESGMRFDLGTVVLKLAREDSKEGHQIVITAESKGGVLFYPMASTITSRLREDNLAQIEADDLRSKPSYKHRRFTWLPEGVDYHRRDHCKDKEKTCRDPAHMVATRGGATEHCRDKRCTKDAHRVWRPKEAFRLPGAAEAYHTVAACYVARGFDLRPGAPPQRIRIVNNHEMWDVAVRGVEERTIEVPAGKFACYKLGFDTTTLHKEADDAADEAEGPFGLTGHADLYVDKATNLLVLLDGQIELGAMFKVQVMLMKRQSEPAASGINPRR